MDKKNKLTLDDGAPAGNNTGKSPVDEDTLNWDELPKLRKEIVVSLISNQSLHSEFCKLFSNTIEADPKLRDMAVGVSESFKDIAYEIADVDKLCVGKTGDASDIDDQVLYIRVSSSYNEKLEKIATIMSNGYMDVFTELSMRGDNISAEDIARFKLAIDSGMDNLNKEAEAHSKGITND